MKKFLKSFGFQTFIGLFSRGLILAPFVALLLYTGKYAEFIDNIATFTVVILAIGTILYLAIMTIIPPEYAIKTDIRVLEFNRWKPQIMAVYFMALASFVVCIGLASQAMYVSAVIMFLWSVSISLWPSYVKRVDDASKEHMLKKITE